MGRKEARERVQEDDYFHSLGICEICKIYQSCKIHQFHQIFNFLGPLDC